MLKIRHTLVILSLSVLIIALSFFNAGLVEEKYLGREVGLTQYNALLKVDPAYARVGQGKQILVEVTVTNTGTMTWLSSEEAGIFLTYRIKEEGADRHREEGPRTAFPQAVKTGDSLIMQLLIAAPQESGKYSVIIDVVHETITWFESKGSAPAILELDVTE